MKSDEDLKRDVDNELKWNPEIDSTDIGTTASSGAVTLSGSARNFHETHQAVPGYMNTESDLNPSFLRVIATGHRPVNPA
jgi:hypothetical protein